MKNENYKVVEVSRGTIEISEVEFTDLESFENGKYTTKNTIKNYDLEETSFDIEKDGVEIALGLSKSEVREFFENM